jgi:hypothetical protein
MAVSYPDIIGEYFDSPERFETGGLQYAGYYESTQIAPEQVSNLYLLVQNTLNVPLEVSLKAELPQTGGLFGGGKPMLKVIEPLLQLKLASAEAGLLTLPVTTTSQIKEGEYTLNLEIKVTGERGQRIRPAQSQSKLERTLIDNPVGLNLIGTLGATFTTKVVKKAPFTLKVSGKPNPPERAPKLNHSYHTLWVEENGQLYTQAIQEINLRQVKFKNELTPEALYTVLFAENTARFADAAMPLRVGEAITLGKIFTYTAQYFLTHPDRYNGLLVPMWESALAQEADTTQPLEVIRTVGYHHLLKITLALSFGLVAQAMGRQHWPLNERQAVIDYITENIETGQAMDPEFLYLPLLMAGTCVSRKIQLAGEDTTHSLALLKQARLARKDLFLDEDMAEANQIFNQLLKMAAA